MIDEKLYQAIEKSMQALSQASKGIDPYYDIEKVRDEALTAIYEIGLEVIGPDIKPHREPGLGVKYATYLTNDEAAINDLKAHQRKAWAKACGVEEK